MDHQLRNLPSVGEEHGERLCCWSQLDLQHPGVGHLPPPGSVLHLLRSVPDLQSFSYFLFLWSERKGDKAQTASSGPGLKAVIVIKPNTLCQNQFPLSSVLPDLIRFHRCLHNPHSRCCVTSIHSLPCVKSTKEVIADWHPEALWTIFLPQPSSIAPQSMCFNSRFLLRQEGTDLSWSWRIDPSGMIVEASWVNDRFHSLVCLSPLYKNHSPRVKTDKNVIMLSTETATAFGIIRTCLNS